MSAIREALLPALAERFPEHGLRAGEPPEPIAVFPGRHPSVGDLRIWDEGEEATVAVGKIMHFHVSPYDPSLGEAEMADYVTEHVVSALVELFADRTLIWQSPDGRAGGMGPRSGTRMGMDEYDETFVWSGPVPNPLS